MSSSKITFKIKFLPLYDTKLHRNPKLRIRWVNDTIVDNVQYIPISLDSWQEITLQAPIYPDSIFSSSNSNSIIALAISCYVGNDVCISNAIASFSSQQLIGSIIIPNINTTYRLNTNLSIGMDINNPTFEIYIDYNNSNNNDQNQSKPINSMTKFGKINKNADTNTTQTQTQTQAKLLIKDEITTIFNKLLTVDPSNKWIRRSLRLINIIFDARECNLWCGNMIPSLFSDLLITNNLAQQHIQFYINQINLSLQELDLSLDELTGNNGSDNKVKIAEVLARSLTRTTHLYLYGPDSITANKNDVINQPNYIHESKSSWRLQYQLLKTSSSSNTGTGAKPECNNNNSCNPGDYILQEGDQLSIPRLAANPDIVLIDCEDAALDVTVNYYFLKHLIQDTSMHQYIPSRYLQLFKHFTQYTIMMCDCNMLDYNTRYKIDNHELKTTDVLSADQYFIQEQNMKQGTQLNPSDGSFAEDKQTFQEHVTCIGLSTDLFSKLVRRGRETTLSSSTNSTTSNTHPIPDMPSIVLEGTDTYFACQLPESSYQSNYGPLAQQPYKLVQFSKLFIKTYMYSSIWSFLQPKETTINCKRYGFASCIYSNEIVDGQYTGQLWFKNIKTKCIGIPFYVLLDQNYMAKSSEWALVSMNDSDKPFNKQDYMSVIQEELKIPCYEATNKIDSIPIGKSGSGSNHVGHPIMLYCREVDWPICKSSFLTWIEQHSKLLNIGHYDSTIHFIQATNIKTYIPEKIKLNQFQTIYRVCIQMV